MRITIMILMGIIALLLIGVAISNRYHNEIEKVQTEKYQQYKPCFATDTLGQLHVIEIRWIEETSSNFKYKYQILLDGKMDSFPHRRHYTNYTRSSEDPDTFAKNITKWKIYLINLHLKQLNQKRN